MSNRSKELHEEAVAPPAPGEDAADNIVGAHVGSGERESTRSNVAPPEMPEDAPSRLDAPDSGEIEFAGGFISTPPAPGETRAGSKTSEGRKPREG